MLKLLKNLNFSGFTLIIPSVSVGNVPQLTIDLLISNYNLTKIGTIWHPAIIPTVGGDPFEPNSENICTACEVYANEAVKLAVVQLRSALETKLVHKFLVDLNSEIINLEFGRIIILSSAFDYELHDIDKGKFYYADSKNEKVLEKLTCLPLKIIDGKYIVPGGGYAIKLYQSIENNCWSTVLVKYVSEGDNIPDAISMIQVLCKYLENLSEDNVKSLKFPHSWSHLFGGPPPVGMF